MSKRLWLVLMGWLIFVPSVVSAETVEAFNREAIIEVLKTRFSRVVSVDGSYDMIPAEDLKLLESGLGSAGQKVITDKHWREIGATMIHVIWISSTEFLYYPEKSTGKFPGPGVYGLLLPYVRRDGTVYKELAHLHGSFHQMLAIGRVQAPLPAEELVRTFSLSPEELERVSYSPPNVVLLCFITLLVLLVFLYAIRILTGKRREEIEIAEPARPIVAPPPPRRERRKEEPSPFRSLNPPPSLPELTPQEIEERCARIRRELVELRSVADEESVASEIVRLIDRFDNKPNTARRLRMAEYALREARRLVEIRPTLSPEPEALPASEPRPIVRFEGRKELVDRLGIEDLLHGLNAECAKTILVILIHPGARDPYFGSHRIWGGRLLRSLETAGFSREIVGETIAGLVRMGVVLRGSSSRSQWYEASYSIALVGDGSGATAQIIQRVLVLRTEVMQGLRAA